MSEVNQLKILDTVQGNNFVTIQSALAVLHHRNLELAKYKIEVMGDSHSTTVIFHPIDHEIRAAEVIAVRQGSDTEMEAGDVRTLISDQNHLKVLDTLHGAHLGWIQAALKIFTSRSLGPLGYKITVVSENKDTVVVLFTDKDAQTHIRGAGGARPGFEVELRVHDLHVIRSNFVR